MTISRKETYEVGLMAWQAGLTVDQAARAIDIGARMLAHGFNDQEIDSMVRWQYQQWSNEALNNIGLSGGAPRW